MKRALITGIYGFTGSHLTEYLSELGIEIYGLDLPSEGGSYSDHLKCVGKMYHVDIRDRDSILEIIHSIKPHYVFHLAGLIGNNDLKNLMETNVFGTRNVLDAVRTTDSKILIPGSAAEYGAVPEDKLPIHEATPLYPISNYGISKVAQTLLGFQYFFKYQCQAYIARPFNIFGPREPENLVCSTIAQQIVKNEQEKGNDGVVYVGNIEPKRDFIDVRDVVEAYWSITNRGVPGEIYNVCSAKAYSISEILTSFQVLSKRTFKVKQDPRRMRDADIPVNFGSNKKIRESTGWYPKINLSKTLLDLLEHYRQKSVSD